MPDETEMRFAIFSHIAQKESVTIHERLTEFAAETRLADQLGFDYFFTTEHHFSKRFSLSPSQPVTLTVIAQNTTRIRFGPMVIIVPLSQPLRVLEEMLILDHMSNGRLEIGLGRGITPHEHHSYGIFGHHERDLFAEGVDFIMTGLTADGRFSWPGEHFQYFDIELPWGPLQRPHPPIWIPTNSADSAYEYGKRGFGIGGFGLIGYKMFGEVFEQYERGCDEVELPADQRRRSILCSTLVADTDQKARELARENFLRQLDLFRYERVRSGASFDRETRMAADLSLARMDMIGSDIDAAEADLRFICGSPDTVAEKIARIRDDIGMNVFIGEFSFGELPYEVVARSYELFASKVMPALGRTPSTIDG